MNRFDPEFHDIDPATNRAFSGGHPDGVWIIAIIFGLIIAATAVPAGLNIVAGLKGNMPFNTGQIVTAVIACVTLLPPLFLLFGRRKLAVAWIVVVGVLALGGVVYFYLQAQDQNAVTRGLVSALLASCGLVVAVVWYVAGLARHKLLT